MYVYKYAYIGKCPMYSILSNTNESFSNLLSRSASWQPQQTACLFRYLQGCRGTVPSDIMEHMEPESKDF